MEYLDLIVRELEERINKALKDKTLLPSSIYTVDPAVDEKLAADKALKDSGIDPTPKTKGLKP